MELPPNELLFDWRGPYFYGPLPSHPKVRMLVSYIRIRNARFNVLDGVTGTGDSPALVHRLSRN